VVVDVGVEVEAEVVLVDLPQGPDMAVLMSIMVVAAADLPEAALVVEVAMEMVEGEENLTGGVGVDLRAEEAEVVEVNNL